MPEAVFPSPETPLLGSAPPDTIVRIIEALDAADSLNGVMIRYGLLAKLPTERERLYMLGTTTYRRVPYSGGHRVRTETYEVRGLAEVHLLGTAGPEPAIGRVWQIIDAADATLTEDPDLESAHYTGELRVISDEVSPMTDGWLARAIFGLGMHRSR